MAKASGKSTKVKLTIPGGEFTREVDGEEVIVNIDEYLQRNEEITQLAGRHEQDKEALREMALEQFDGNWTGVSGVFFGGGNGKGVSIGAPKFKVLPNEAPFQELVTLATYCHGRIDREKTITLSGMAAEWFENTLAAWQRDGVDPGADFNDGVEIEEETVIDDYTKQAMIDGRMGVQGELPDKAREVFGQALSACVVHATPSVRISKAPGAKSKAASKKSK
jgi:hypothetical protein